MIITRLDLKASLAYLYKPSAKQFSLVEAPPLHYLMIDGEGDPNTAQAFKDESSRRTGWRRQASTTKST